MTSEVRYAKNDQVNIAYRIYGQGERMIVVIPGWVSNIEEYHLIPGLNEWVTDLARRGRVLLFDKRGVGLSDRVDEKDLPGLGERMEDLEAILDKEHIGKSIIYGFSEGGPMALFFAATFPDRVEKLILYASFACWVKKPGYPEGIAYHIHEKSIEEIINNWGGPVGLELMAPSMSGDPLLREGYASYLRKSASPGAAAGLYRMNLTIDVREILKDIQAPVLVIHRKGDKLIPCKMGGYLAHHIEGARYELLSGDVHWPWLGNSQEVMEKVDNFLGIPQTVDKKQTKIQTFLGVRFYDEKQVPGFMKHLSTEGIDPKRIFNLERQVTVIVNSPDMAIRYISRYLEKMPNVNLTALIHMGLCNEEKYGEMGSAADLTTAILYQLKEPGIFLTAYSTHLISNHLHEYSLFSRYTDPETGFVTRLFRYNKMKFLMDQTIQKLIKEGKVGIADIGILYEIKKYLDKDFLSNPSIENLSRQFGINTFKLKYGFKNLFDSSVKSYIQSLRLNYAYHLVKESDLSIEEIAFKIGYSHTSTFTSVFNERYGFSPSMLRRSSFMET
jgi:pimeloyl-ACP methyl ester carboxylesterase/AraC-like DNA-binding protein